MILMLARGGFCECAVWWCWPKCLCWLLSSREGLVGDGLFGSGDHDGSDGAVDEIVLVFMMRKDHDTNEA